MADLAEMVPRMPPVSMSLLERVGDQLRAELGLDPGPDAVDVLALVERKLARYGIFVYPASALELEDRLGATFPDEGGTTILLRHDVWDDLVAGGRRANMARATAVHEIGHAVLHVPEMRRRLATSPFLALAGLNRTSRAALRPYEDPEWQAWALAGCILAPRARLYGAIERGEATVFELARRFEVSEGLMTAHLKRLKMLGRRPPQDSRG